MNLIWGLGETTMKWDTFVNDRFIYFILGVIFFAAGVISTCARKIFGGFGGWAYRDKNPSKFWWTVAVLYAGSALCIGIWWGILPETLFHSERLMR